MVIEIKLDDLDKGIIAGLVDNCKTQSKDLSRKLRIHPNTLLQRLKRLESLGVIMKYTAIVDYAKIDKGLQVLVFLNVRMSEGWEDQIKPLSRFPEVVSFSLLTGDYDAVMVARIRDESHLAYFLRKLQSNRAVARTTTHIVVDHYKHAHEYNPLWCEYR